jgi:putative peptidoglycan lipid II flippase
MAQDSRYLGSAKLIAICTLTSRITGLARDIVLNRAFGQNWVQDAFNYGFLIPNLFRRLFGEGALSAVFVPVFTDVLDKEGKPAAWALLGRVTSLLVLTLSILTIILELAALAVWHFAPGGPMRSLQIGLSAVMLPFMISICTLALFSSILNCVGHFTVPALMPIVLNLLNIFGVLFVGPKMGDAMEEQVFGVAYSVLAASVLQVILILPVMKRHGIELRFLRGFSDPNVLHMRRMFLPVVIGQGVLLLSVFMDSQVCTFLTQGPQDPPTRHILGMQIEYPLHEGALSAVNNAQRLYQFPLGVLAISLATAAFPMFSLYASRRDFAGLRQTLGQSLRVAIFEGMPCGFVLVILAQPIISLLFEYGQFGPDDTSRAAWVLVWYAIGMPAYCCQQILLRGFYSLKDTLTPMWIGCGLVALNLAINVSLLWQPKLREAAFGIGTAITSGMHVLISFWFLRKAMQGRIGFRAVLASVMKTSIASIAAGATAWAITSWVAGSEPQGIARFAEYGRLLSRALHVFLPLGAAILVYLAAARLMRMQELAWLMPRRKYATAPPDLGQGEL